MKSFLPNIKSLLEHHKLLVFFFLSVIVLRIPSLFEPYWYGDEGVYLTLGLTVRRGLVLYRDIHDNKPPLLYWLAALSENLFWFKFLLLTTSLASIALFYKLSRLIFSESKKAVLIACGLFTLLTTLPLVEGNIANAENFLILFTILGMLLLIYKEKITTGMAVLIGFCFSIAILFKVPAGADFGAVFFFLLFFQNKNPKKIIIPLLMGLFIPIFFVTLYYFLRGAFSQFITAAFLQNIGYLSSWQTGSHAAKSLPMGLISRGFLVLGTTGILFSLRKKLPEYFILCVLWFAFAMFGATLSGRPYAHYLLETVPALSLILGYLVLKTKISEKILMAGSVIALIISIAYFRFWFYSPFTYYKNFVSFAVGIENKTQYFNRFNPSVNRNYKVSDYLAGRTKSSDKIFVWGDEPFIYALSRRLPAGRYTVAYHVIDFQGQRETEAALLSQKPKFIVKIAGEKKQFPEMDKIILDNYKLITTIDDADLYLLLN